MACIAGMFDELCEFFKELKEAKIVMPEGERDADSILTDISDLFDNLADEIRDWTPPPELESQLSDKMSSEDYSDLDYRIDKLEEFDKEDHEERLDSLEGETEKHFNEIQVLHGYRKELSQTVEKLAETFHKFMTLYQDREGMVV